MVCWLIERTDLSIPIYFLRLRAKGTFVDLYLTFDPFKATQFKTRQSAEALLRNFKGEGKWKAVEHSFNGCK